MTATVTDPDDPSRIFGWLLTETRDPLGNRIVYRYDSDEGAEPGHRWSVPLLREIAYADWTDAAGAERFAATIAFEDEPRDSFPQDLMLANAPDRSGEFFRVPKIIEESPEPS